MKKLSIYTFLVVFLFSFSLSADNENLYKKLNTFGDVFETIRSNYVSDVDEEDVIEAAINGMLQSLDPHSSYMNLENYLYDTNCIFLIIKKTIKLKKSL